MAAGRGPRRLPEPGLPRRLIAKELILSFVPDGELRIWRNLTQLVRDRVRLQSQIKCLLEEMRIKLSVVVSDPPGSSGLCILHALANGEIDAKSLASLGDDRLRCTEKLIYLHFGWGFLYTISSGNQSDRRFASTWASPDWGLSDDLAKATDRSTLPLRQYC